RVYFSHWANSIEEGRERERERERDREEVGVLLRECEGGSLCIVGADIVHANRSPLRQRTPLPYCCSQNRADGSTRRPFPPTSEPGCMRSEGGCVPSLIASTPF